MVGWGCAWILHKCYGCSKFARPVRLFVGSVPGPCVVVFMLRPVLAIQDLSADLVASSPPSTTGAPLPIMQLFGVLVRQGQPMIDEHLLTIAEAAIKLVLPQLQR